MSHRYELLQEELSCLLISTPEPALAEDMNTGDETFAYLLIDDTLPEGEEEDSAI